jgi:hypothetical protein
MYLLQGANVTMDVANTPFEHLVAILLFLLILVVILAGIIFANGISFKWKEKEINIGGIRRLLAKKDEDSYLKECLKGFIDDIDHEIQADLFDHIEDMDTDLNDVLLKEHCFFTTDKFFNLVKRELQKRVRRNNLRRKLAKENREKYIANVMKDVEDRYGLFQVKVAAAACEDSFVDFALIKGSMRIKIGLFFDYAVSRLILGMRKKREHYAIEAPKFKTVSARVYSCDMPDLKNKGYIEILTGKPEPAGTWYKL